MRKILFLCGLLLGLVAAPTAAQSDVLEGETIRMLVLGDVFTLALEDATNEMERRTGAEIEIEIVSYDELRELTLLNTSNNASNYDIIAVDIVWIGEYGDKNVLLPLNDLLSDDVTNTADFIEIAFEAGAADDVQLTLPIQPHPELLWYREDLFEEAGLAAPQTTADVLAAAEALHNPEEGLYGICWNGQRGQALGQTMAHFYAAFGQPLLDEDNLPVLDTEAGVAAAEYAQALMTYSPPDILTMAWDQRILRFSQGGCAMTYGWAARTYLVESEPTSQVAGLVGYVGAPYEASSQAVTPMGVWSVGIPANIGEREAIAWEFLQWLTSADTQQLLADFGNGGMPRYSVLENPEFVERYPAFPVVAQLSEADELNDWMRPSVPQWSAMAEILGTVYHDMLRGRMTPAEAAAQAQADAAALFE